ncbi:hypothetical protein [Paenibacillus sp. SI8]|uniref:hypothetical protein n=1 Tax=unclassified Paenibacillus TaxID=185978 RepID=UPI0034668B05
MLQDRVKVRKLTAYWLFNILLGVPTSYVFIFIIIKYYGLLSPALRYEQYEGLGVLFVYLLIWLSGNYASLRQESGSTRIGMLVLSPMLVIASAFISYQIIALFTM